MLKAKILTNILCLFCSVAGFAQTSKQTTAEPSKTNFKFLDEISLQASTAETAPTTKPFGIPSVKKELLAVAKTNDASVESAGGLQFKYSLLLDTEVETLRNIPLLRVIDEWYGVHYVYGGGTKSGIDCSALMQVFFTTLYGISLPRTAKMQYDASRRISRTELKEGDLLFFNTRGGVSHVGMYLANNKFVHASTKGVAISDMFDPYYAARLVGAGRVLDDAPVITATASLKP